jgi:hypothetical protein
MGRAYWVAAFGAKVETSFEKWWGMMCTDLHYAVVSLNLILPKQPHLA